MHKNNFLPLQISTGRAAAALSITLFSVAISPLPARAGLVTNGSFENISVIAPCGPAGGANSASCFATNGPTETPPTGFSFNIDDGGTVTGWTVGGDGPGAHTLDCLVYSGETTGLCGASASGTSGTPFQFWQDPGASPDDGNYVAVDGDSTWSQPFQTIVNGLTVGTDYMVSFYQAAAQQNGFSGATTEQWQVMFGADTQTSTLMNNAANGKVDWNRQQLTFNATSSSQVLAFLALGTPNSLPPFVLLDGVSVDPAVAATPEPASAAQFLAGVLCAGLFCTALRPALGIRNLRA